MYIGNLRRDEMAIYKEYGKYTLYCDRCDKKFTGCDSFQDAVDLKRIEGWKSIKEDGIWRDLCRECRYSPKEAH